MAEVVLKKVCKTFPGGVRAVRDVDLRIGDTEFVVLVGPSGCGKSTTLRMVAGLEEITGGTIRIGGRVVNDVPPKNRDIAMVFQNYALYPHMTVYKNMAFALKLRKIPKAEIDRRVREAAKILGIAELLDRKPKALSGGQRQRVAVGRAIVRAAQGVPVRRAAVQPRRQAPRGDAGRAQTPPPAAGHDDDLRHARPGRGHDPRRPDRGDEGRPHPAGGSAAGGLQRPAEPFRGRASSARRR